MNADTKPARRLRQQELNLEDKPVPKPAAPLIAPTRSTGPRLEDLAGMAKAREWGQALKRDLDDYRAGKIIWDDVDRGCVLHGLPGTGKTTFVKALAATCDVPLYVTSFSEWQQTGDGHLGNVHMAIDALFTSARQSAPCIVFIDELDSIPRRGSHMAYAEYYNSIVNALLAQLDGAIPRPGVVVVGACNNAKDLDPALIRAGRLDRLISIPLPSVEALIGIFGFHLKDDGFRLLSVPHFAQLCQGKTGADIEQIVRTARRRARQARRILLDEDIAVVIDEEFGTLSVLQQRKLAVHEAGHAIYGLRRGLSSNISVSLVSRSTDLNRSGVTGFAAPNDIDDQIRFSLAGRAAEEFFFGGPCTGSGEGPESDLAIATQLAFSSIASYGHSSFAGLTWLGRSSVDQHVLADTLVAIEIRQRLKDAYEEVTAFLKPEKRTIAAVAEALLKYRTLNHQQLVQCAALIAN